MTALFPCKDFVTGFLIFKVDVHISLFILLVSKFGIPIIIIEAEIEATDDYILERDGNEIYDDETLSLLPLVNVIKKGTPTTYLE